MEETYKDIWTQLSLRNIEEISSIDTNDGKIVLAFLIYDDMILGCCEEMLHTMTQSLDYKWVDYYVIY